MEIKELRALESHELVVRLDQARRELMNQRFQFAMGQLTDTSRFKISRRNIARILTVLREREKEAAEEAAREGTKK
jgi:large subunit ribosomal protein L29